MQLASHLILSLFFSALSHSFLPVFYRQNTRLFPSSGPPEMAVGSARRPFIVSRVMQQVPLGPLAACDIFNRAIVIFDEKHNRIFFKEFNKEPVEYNIAKEYSTEFYYWARIHFISKAVFLALLKSHSNRIFYLVSFKMDLETKECLRLKHVKTNIFSKGYKIQSHLAGSQIVFSVNNVAKGGKWIKNTVSDRDLFEKQLQQEKLSQSQPPSPSVPSPTTAPPGQIGDTLGSSPRTSADSQRDEPQNAIREGVLMVVKCQSSGEISGTIVSLGKQRLGVKLRRVPSLKKWKDTMGMKSMTKWGCEEDEQFCEPVLAGSQALMISRNDASLCCLLDTVINPRFGLVASVQERIHNGFKMTTAPCDPLRANVAGLPPDASHIWSNIEVLEGDPLLLTVAPQTGFCLLFQLQQMSGPRLFWKRQEISISMATTNLTHIFLRAVRDKETKLVDLCIRGMITTGDVTKSFVEIVQCRL